MQTEFYKYQGAGNDFILINDPTSAFPADRHDLIRHLCDRRFGIGADGMILIRKHPDLDFQMIYFNADGHEGSMCGNGGRCTVAFAHRMKMCGQAANFMAVDGTHLAKVIRPDYIQLKMQSVSSIRIQPDHFELDTGSPHYVTFVEDLENLDVFGIGQKIRLSNAFRAEGINVNFVEQTRNMLFVRTYERGVENETLSCGTGVVASAICAAMRDPSPKSEYNIRTHGGDLTVSFRKEGENDFRNIILEGPAEFVFKGSIEF